MNIKIVAAAISTPRGAVFTGVRHSEILQDLKRLGFKPPFLRSKGFLQGFIDSKGVFYDRESAKNIVITSGQYHHSKDTVLTSEDLW